MLDVASDLSFKAHNSIVNRTCKKMLSATVLLALISAVSSAKIFEEDYRRPAVTADLIKAVNVSEFIFTADVLKARVDHLIKFIYFHFSGC